MKIIISEKLSERLKIYQSSTSFKNPNELVEYILEKYLSQLKDEDDLKSDKSDKEILNDRLKNLGYL